MSIQPQVSYGDEPTLPKRRVYFDYNGSDALSSGSILCYDLSALDADGKPIVAKPLTADLSAVAGVYVGDQGEGIAEDRWIDIVPADAYGHVVTVTVASATYAENDGIKAANDSFGGVAATGDGNAAVVEPGFLGLCLDAGTLTSVAVLLTR